jgi:hypothetical protein
MELLRFFTRFSQQGAFIALQDHKRKLPWTAISSSAKKKVSIGEVKDILKDKIEIRQA